MMPKKFVLPLTIIALLGIGIGVFLLLKKPAKTDDQASKKPPINEPVNVLELEKRPFINLIPRNDGREITLNIETLPQDASEMEYELEYQAGTLLQGAFGNVDFSSEPIPVSKKILLGSCSAGGACSYHEDVSGGSLLMRFRGDPNYVLKTEWRFQATSETEGEFSSRDSKFQVDAGKVLDTANYVIILSTSGLPADAPGEVLSGPYGIYPSSTPKTGSQIELTMRLSEDATDASIYGYNGSEWIKFDTTVEDKTATATVDLLSVYVVAR